MRIGWDIDGPGYGFVDAFYGYAKQVGAVPNDYVPVFGSYNFYEGHGMTREEFIQLCHDGVDAGEVFWKGTPEPGYFEAMAKLAKAGHSNHIVTARGFGSPGAAARATAQWLIDHGAVFHSLTLADDKTSVPTDAFIEDHLGNYDALEAAGCMVYLIDKPWNQVEGDSRRRVSSPLEFAERILALSVTHR